MWARAATVVCAAAVMAACQPAGGPAGGPPTAVPGAPDEPVLGAPVAGMPATVGELVRRARLVAEEWQDEPVLAEIEVELDAEQRWSAARVMYLAGEADRFLALETAGSGFSQQRPTLATLQSQPVTSEGLAEIPPLPDDVVEPDQLAQSDAAEECGVTVPASVLYVTGAPVAWDGTTWTRPPDWRASVTSDAATAVVDPRTGVLDRCLE